MEQPHAAAAAEAGAGADEYCFCELLSQLSPSPPLTEDAFRSRFSEFAALGANHLILVAEDAATGRLAAAGSVLVERKFIRRCGSVGHVEDVEVDAAARGRGLGERVVRRLVEHAKGRGCYKVILNCTPELRGFYAKCGFVKKNVQMIILKTQVFLKPLAHISYQRVLFYNVSLADPPLIRASFQIFVPHSFGLYF